MSTVNPDFRSLGNLELLNRPLLAIFSSAKCPASLILKAHGYPGRICHTGMATYGRGFGWPINIFLIPTP
jgi:hypothetical protein